MRCWCMFVFSGVCISALGVHVLQWVLVLELYPVCEVATQQSICCSWNRRMITVWLAWILCASHGGCHSLAVLVVD
jgi:hypothetical protein